ncbi:hypothetical protein [Runella slithyformis]|uniref:hypothetical protein n=1 Tax=Runella slithyformis TaxID=106 RepID=UPI00146A93A6|nr:hypothetical protein [Runella slithyformis]
MPLTSTPTSAKQPEIADWDYHNKGYMLPDQGNGIPSILSEETVIVGAPFSQNIYRL